MSKIKKSELKAIVKECLYELLSEGLGGQSEVKMQVEGRSRLPRSNTTVQHSNPAPVQQTNVQNSAVKAAVKEVAAGNSILEGILADTAATSLPGFMAADRSSLLAGVAGDPASQAAALHTPDEIFGEEVTSKWADLAFKAAHRPV